MKQELISIDNTPAIIDVNFEELKAALAKDLEKYDVVVTAETVADAKKLATELNATKAVIGKRRKEEVAKASEPVKVFDGKMKDLETMCEEGRQKILAQVKTFEDETRDLAAHLLAELLEKLFADNEVEAEFRRAQFGDLVKLTAVTKTENLTAAVTKELEGRVRDDKAIQDRTKMRLLELENKSYTAGLAAPLTRNHVEHFLFADQGEYEAQLQRIIDSEIQRQEVAEQRQREKIEREQRQAEQARQEREEREARLAQQQEESQDEPSPEPSSGDEGQPDEQSTQEGPAAEVAPGRVRCKATCTFSTTVAQGVSAEAVEAELRKVLAKAGINTLDTVTVEFVEGEA